MVVVSTEAKLAALLGRPLLVDTGDAELDRELAGYVRVVTGYDREVVYPISDGDA
jgi:predicted polyphosphate/ATP-dependent NAD kinase